MIGAKPHFVYLFQINGKLTLGENIADNGGFKASHRVGAFKSKEFIFGNRYSIPSDALIGSKLTGCELYRKITSCKIIDNHGK